MVTWDIARGQAQMPLAPPSPHPSGQPRSCTCQRLLVPDWGAAPFRACQPSLMKPPELREMVDFVEHLGSRPPGVTQTSTLTGACLAGIGEQQRLH